jgi:hypothetical protein
MRVNAGSAEMHPVWVLVGCWKNGQRMEIGARISELENKRTSWSFNRPTAGAGH